MKFYARIPKNLSSLNTDMTSLPRNITKLKKKEQNGVHIGMLLFI